MLFAIDVGNTHTVFALCQDRVLQTWRFATDPHRTEDEYGIMLSGLMRQEDMDPAQIKGAILSSVVPDAVFALKRYCEKYIKQPLFIVHPEAPLSILNIAIDHPAELGADRLVNAVGAWHRYKQAIIILDFGTATTFDAINATGTYVGGSIAPGVNLSLEALQQAAAKLHGISICQIDKAIGTNTTSAMQSGLYFGYRGLIKEIVSKMKQELGGDVKVIATGGLAELFARNNPLIDSTEPDLTVHGLMLLYDQYQESNT